MIETSNILVEALGKSLETMAFLTATAPEEELETPEKSYLIEMHIEGPLNGTVEMLAGHKLGQTTVENISGVEQADEDNVIDVLKELLNVACGLLLPVLPAMPEDKFDITVPELKEICDREQWEQFVRQDGVTVLDVEGQLLASRLTIDN